MAGDTGTVKSCTIQLLVATSSSHPHPLIIKNNKNKSPSHHTVAPPLRLSLSSPAYLHAVGMLLLSQAPAVCRGGRNRQRAHLNSWRIVLTYPPPATFVVAIFLSSSPLTQGSRPFIHCLDRPLDLAFRVVA